MARGIVYVLTHPTLHTKDGAPLVKIGRTGDSLQHLKDRIMNLSGTGVPGRYRLYYAVSVKDGVAAEKLLHDAFGNSRYDKNKEFFAIAPERVESAMRLTLIHGQSSGRVAGEIERLLKRKTPKPDNPFRSPFKFIQVGVVPGEELTFKDDPSLKATVVDNHNKVKFEGKEYSLSGAADVVVKRKGRKIGVSGPLYWCYKGEILGARRRRMEKNR